jgi:hypothetical protein
MGSLAVYGDFRRNGAAASLRPQVEYRAGRMPVKERSREMNLRTFVSLTEIVDTSHWEPVHHDDDPINENGWAVVDMSVPQTEEHNWGVICLGCSSREDAEQYICDYNTADTPTERGASHP